MEQFIIDRYHEGQDEYKITDFAIDIDTGINYIVMGQFPLPRCNINLYEFLFNPKWGFAKAFSKTIYDNHQCHILDGGHNLEDEYSYDAIEFDLERMLLEEMATSKDHLKYLKLYKM